MGSSSDAASSPSPPPLGTFIDNGALELVEVLGYGGYGVVYRAVDTYSLKPTSYAVKCLPHSQKRNTARQRQLHMREITLHKLASAHPNVVTLHRVIEDYQYTYIVMDYCPDGDLFAQILHHRRYLGNNALIKDVFLQLLDAVEYCHSLHIYHRDLKPENVLCFDGGLRLAITDFGLATTDEMSTEFRTGSVYHMSPECQGAYFTPTRTYSPLFNDIWSLGIILLNLITGRNPWKSAAPDDCTFQAYLRDPLHFLPTVLPISEEVNQLLVRTLEVDWRHRITLREMRAAVKEIDSFYSPDVLFEDSMARCPWEAGVNVDSESESSSSSSASAEEPEPQQQPHEDEGFTSTWSESESEMVFANRRTAQSSWADSLSYDAPRYDSYGRSMSPSPSSPLFTTTKLFDALDTPSNPSTYSVVSSSPSCPATPGLDERFSQQQVVQRPRLHINVNTDACRPVYYDNSVVMLSAQSSSMHTALESQIDGYALCSPYLSATIPGKTSLLFTSQDELNGANADDEDVMDSASAYTYPTIDDPPPSAARPESPTLGLGLGSPSGSTTAVERFTYNWEQYTAPSSPTQDPPISALSFLTFSSTPAPSPQSERAWHTFAFTPQPQKAAPAASLFTFSFRASPTSPAPLPIRPPRSPASQGKVRTASFLNPIRLAFPGRSSSPLARASTLSPVQRKRERAATHTPPAPAPSFGTSWAFSQSTSSSPSPQPYLCLPPAAGDKAVAKLTSAQRASQRRKKLREARAWFSPSKLFSAVLP